MSFAPNEQRRAELRESQSVNLDRIADSLERITHILEATIVDEAPLERIAENLTRIAGCLSLGLDDLGRLREIFQARELLKKTK